MANARGRRRNKKEYYFDNTLLLCVLLLLFCGLIVLYSTSSYSANLEHGDAAFYLKKQCFATALGLVGMFLVSKIDYHSWTKLAIPIYIFSLVLIALVKTPLGRTLNGARRWIYIGSLSIQPAEVAKVALIIMTTAFICALGKGIRKIKSIMITLCIAAVPAVMILVITKNMSSAIIVLGIAAVMIFVADPHYARYFALVAVVAVVAVIVVTLVLNSGDSAAGGFRGDRIKAWRDPEAYASDEGFQTLQALYAIGSGGIIGKGLGQSMQKLGFLPEAQNDMVFSIICEELGLFGAVCVILLFGVLIYRFMVVANNAPDLYGAMLVVGVMGHIAIQVILNIAVVTNTIPNTGITLPFISYGGTSILFLLAEIGIVLNVSSKIHLRDIE